MATIELERYLRDGNRSYHACLEACVECLVACEMCSDACLDDDPKMMARCIRLDREVVRRIVSEESPRAIQTSVQLARHTLALRLLVVGSAAGVADLERCISARVARATGVTPDITTVAVPDAQHLLSLIAADGRTRVSAADVLPPVSAQQWMTDALVAE